MSDEKPLTVREAGRKGGEVCRDRHGAEHFSQAGKKGGAATVERYGVEHYARIGRKGGAMRGKKAAEGDADSGAEG